MKYKGRTKFTFPYEHTSYFSNQILIFFQLNEQRYGVQSTFDNSLSGYTIQIQEKDTQDYRLVFMYVGGLFKNLR